MSIQSVAEAAQDQVQDGNIEAGAITTLVSIINSASNVLGNLSSDGRLDVAEVCTYVLMQESMCRGGAWN